MHEMMFASRVLREARGSGANRFLRVEVGELCEITAEEMGDGLKRLTSGVLSEESFKASGGMLAPAPEVGDLEFGGMKFKVDFKESKVKCSCGYDGRAKISDRGHGYCLFCCPKCEKSGKDLKVLEGGEIRIVEVE